MKRKNKILENYNQKQQEWKNKIKQEQNKFKRFGKGVGYLVAFPWVGTFYNIRDWRTAVIFSIVVVVLSSEVGVPYLLGWILHNNGLLGVGTACWLFGLGPGTPFMVICIMVTIFIKGIFNKNLRKKEGETEC